MTRQDKDEVVAKVKGHIEKANALFVTNLVGISANDSVALRKKVRDVNGYVCIARNTLLARAAKGTYAETKIKDLTGPTALAFSFQDAAAVAKVLNDFSKENEIVAVKAGYLDQKEITKQEVVQLANLPSKDQMLGTLLATFLAPVSAFARVMHAIKEQKEKQTTVA